MGNFLLRRGRGYPYTTGALEKKKQNFAKRMTVNVSSHKTWHASGDAELKYCVTLPDEKSLFPGGSAPDAADDKK